MEKALVGIVSLILLAITTVTAVPVWGQCGGIGWTGSTVCDAGSTCVKSNDWYSQCLPGSSSPTTIATTVSGPLPTGSANIPRGTLTQISNFGSNPNNVGMFVYVPQSLKANPGLLAAIHPCGGTAQSFYSGTDFKSLADRYGFAVVYPDASDPTNCFDVHTDATLNHDAGGDSLGIANGVRYLIDQLDVDPEKVFSTGFSSGGMMTNVLAGAYPDVFRAGASFAGVAYACVAGPTFFNSECDAGRRVRTGEEWGNLVRAAYPGYTGPRPRMQIWHGAQDEVVSPQNYYEALKQWRNVLNASETSTATQQNWPISGWTKTEYGPNVQGILASGITHAIPVQATSVVQWMGLDK